MGPIRGIKGFLENIRYALEVRNTPYIDNEALKDSYLKSRNLHYEKMDSAFVHRTNNDLTQAFDELFSAVDYSDTADSWERKASLAKNINDNKDDVRGALIGMITGYATSLGTTIVMAPAIYTKGLNVFSDIFFWGLLAVFGFGIYTGRFNQKRLQRLVEEHKDYTREFEEITDLQERKRERRIR